MHILPADFHFLRPWCFWALPLMLLLLLILWHNKTKAVGVDKFVDPQLLPHLLLGNTVGGKNKNYPLVLLGCGWLLGVIALAGPAWRELPRPVYSLAAARVVILDLSPSMQAADPQPNRLDRAVFKIKDILRKGREGRTGLLVFAAEAHVVVPLTDDTATIETMLPALNVDIMPASGNSVVEALDLAERLLERGGATGRGDILLLTDGVDDIVEALARAKSLADREMRLSVLAIGTEEGAPVPSIGRGFEIDPDTGLERMATVDLASLQTLSEAGRGEFSPLTTDDTDIDRLLNRHHSVTMDEAREQRGVGVDRWREEGIWLLPVLLIISAFGFRRGWLFGAALVLLCASPQPAGAVTWDDLWLRADQQAVRMLEQGDAQHAADMFKDPSWRGTAQYNAGNYHKAADIFKAQGNDYNLGNALARSGRLQEALAAYDRALEQNPDNGDAEYNRNLVKKLLAEREQQQQGRQGEQKQQDQSEQGDQGQHDQQDESGQGNQDRQDQRDESGQGDQDRQDQQGQSEQGDQDRQNHQGRSGQDNGSDRDNQTADDAQQEAEQDQTQPGPGAEKEQQPTEPEQTEDDHAAPPTTPDRREPDSERQDQTAAVEDPSATPSEEEMAIEQWLRQVPDDPSLLLRRKFMLEHQRRQRQR